MGKAGAGLESLASPRGGASAAEVAARSGMPEGGKPSASQGKASVSEGKPSAGEQKASSIGGKPSSIGAKSSGIGEKASSMGAKSSAVSGERKGEVTPGAGGDKDAEIAALKKALAVIKYLYV